MLEGQADPRPPVGPGRDYPRGPAPHTGSTRGRIRGPDCVTLLKRIRGHAGPKLLVIWDGSPIPRCDEVAWYLGGHGSGDGSSWNACPVMRRSSNPEEGVWEHAKDVELRNCCFAGLDHLSCGLTRCDRSKASRREPHSIVLPGCRSGSLEVKL